MSAKLVEQIIAKLESPPLLQMLLAVQDADPQRHISEETACAIAKQMGVSRSRVYSTASFYSEISLEPRGKHIVRVCNNAPCETSDKAAIEAAICKELSIQVGETTKDFFFTLEEVSCLGACYMSPAVKIDDRTYGNLTPQSVVALLRSIRQEERV